MPHKIGQHKQRLKNFRRGLLAQDIRVDGVPYEVTVQDQFEGKNGRPNYLLHVFTPQVEPWREWGRRSWNSVFQLVVGDDGHFITLFTKKRDPSKKLLGAFMRGDFSLVEVERSRELSALLLRSLISYMADSAYPAVRPHATFPWSPTPKRGVAPHADLPVRPRPLAPLLSDDRELWISCHFSEEVAHRYAFRVASQCRRHVAVYCSPTFTRHHRCGYDGTEVISLPAYLARGGRAHVHRYLPHLRFLLNHLRRRGDQIARGDPGGLQQSIVERRAEGRPPTLAEVQEAKAGLELVVLCAEEAAYFFACANLLNAAMGPARADLGLPKEVYSHKSHVGAVMEDVLELEIPDTVVWREANNITFVQVLGVQFSFHAIPLTDRLRALLSASGASESRWGGLRLQPIAGEVLRWGRALLARVRDPA